MKINFLSSLSIIILFVFTSCGGSTKNEQGSADSTQVQNHAPETQKRASPLMKASASVGNTAITIQYGAPSVKGRTIWGGLEAYNKVWRTGANEATVITIDNDINLNGQKLAAGRYALFTIPTEGDWAVIINRNADQWGAYDYSQADDVMRFKVTPEWNQEHVEVLRFDIVAKEDNKANVELRWEKLKLAFEIAAL